MMRPLHPSHQQQPLCWQSIPALYDAAPSGVHVITTHPVLLVEEGSCVWGGVGGWGGTCCCKQAMLPIRVSPHHLTCIA
jgi:hypothetical protein